MAAKPPVLNIKRTALKPLVFNREIWIIEDIIESFHVSLNLYHKVYQLDVVTALMIRCKGCFRIPRQLTRVDDRFQKNPPWSVGRSYAND